MADSYFKSSDQVLVVHHDLTLSRWDSARNYTYAFDFEFRMMTVVSDYGRAKEAIAVHPFPTLDPDLVQQMHDKLVELGGHPTPPGPVPHAKGAFAAPSPFHKPDGGLKL
jgi:hypothetical protein